MDFIIPKRDRPCSLTLQPHHYVCESDSPFDNRSFVKLHKKEALTTSAAQNPACTPSQLGWSFFLSWSVHYRDFIGRCASIFLGLLVVFYNFCVCITTSVLPQTSAVTVVRNNTYYLVLHLQKQLDTHKLFVFVLIITNVVLSLVSLIKS